MPYTITDDETTLMIRATIVNRIELKELIDKLQQRLDGEDVNITTGEETDERQAG